MLILTYHRVVATRDPLMPDEPDAALFARQLDWIAGVFNVLTVNEAVRLRREGRLPPRSLCITFDDGYANNAEVALPLLSERGLKATFFVATGFIDGGAMWNDLVIESVREAIGPLDLSELGLGRYELPDDAARRAAIGHILGQLKYRPREQREADVDAIARHAGATRRPQLMMTEEQIRSLARAGMEVGAHTVNHPILKRLPSDAAAQEIATSRERLALILGAPPPSFAYPNGRPGTDYEREHVEMVAAAGFDSAVSTAWGCVTSGRESFQLPRIAPWDRDATRYLGRLLRAYRQRDAASV